MIIDTTDSSETPKTNEDHSSRETIEALAEIICVAGDEAMAALSVLVGVLQNSTEPQALENAAKDFAFTCAVSGMCTEWSTFSLQ
jgi:hypothetical protein